MEIRLLNSYLTVLAVPKRGYAFLTARTWWAGGLSLLCTLHQAYITLGLFRVA